MSDKKNLEYVSLSKMKWLLFLLGTFKIPMIRFVRPKLLELNDETSKIRIKLCRRSKNHLNSMYFGALSVGADIAAGMHAFYFSKKMGRSVSFAFKSMNANFLKRAESETTFMSNQGNVVKAAMIKSKETGERVNEPLEVIAIDNSGELVATFILVVSVKVKY
jgi:acyl-coenzyme A thioesterase PaaI-like protein